MDNKSIVHIALFAALTAALGLFPPIPLATGVPISVQSIAPMLAGSILGARKGLLSQVLFLLLVAVGLPLLSGGRGGLGVFVSPTGGFALSFIVTAGLIGFLIERNWQQLSVLKTAIILFFAGMCVTYLIGIPWIVAVVKISPLQAALSCLPFLPGDLIKVGVSAMIAMTIKKSYPMIQGSR